MFKICLLCAPALLLLACSTPQPTAELATTEIPPPEISMDLPLEPPSRVNGALCKLGDSCLALDPRPFEACLVGTKRCVDKATPPVTVDGPAAPPPPAIAVIRK